MNNAGTPGSNSQNAPSLLPLSGLYYSRES